MVDERCSVAFTGDELGAEETPVLFEGRGVSVYGVEARVWVVVGVEKAVAVVVEALDLDAGSRGEVRCVCGE